MFQMAGGGKADDGRITTFLELADGYRESEDVEAPKRYQQDAKDFVDDLASAARKMRDSIFEGLRGGRRGGSGVVGPAGVLPVRPAGMRSGRGQSTG